MQKRVFSLVTVAFVVASTVVVALPAHAASQSLYGTTAEIEIMPSTNSLLGETAYIPTSGGAAVVTLGVAQAADVDVELREGATVLGSCTVPTGSTSCATGTILLAAGSHAVTAYFTKSSTTVPFNGTLFAVNDVAPSATVEWKDASGAWVDGSGIGLLLYGATAARCVVTNNANAAFSFDSFLGTTNYSGGGPDLVPITGTLAAGATGHYLLWTGSVNQNPSTLCSGSVMFPDGVGGGNGNGGGAIALTGTFGVSPSPAAGITVSVTGTTLVPPVITSYPVTLDGVAVAGSPGTTTGPDFDFSVDVAIPSNISPGTHVIAVHSLYQSRDVVLAQFTFTVDGPALAATGVDAAPALGAGGLFVLVGLVFALIGRRRRFA